MTSHIAKSIGEAAALLKELPNARVVAGGTDVVNRTRRFDGGPTADARATDWVDISAIGGDIATVTLSDGVVTIGALATYNTILNSDLVQRQLPSIIECSVGVGSLQIQSRGTIGGNLANASPAGDTWPVLISLGAFVNLVRSESGAMVRRQIPIEELFVGPGRISTTKGELIESIGIPVRDDNWAGFHRVGGHTHHVISKVSGALSARLDDGVMHDVRVAFGAVGPTTLRPRRVEALLEGANPKVTDAISEALKDSLSPISDVRSTQAYRHDAALQILRLLLDRCVQNAG